MDSWSYGSGGRGVVLSDEMVSSSTDALARNRKVDASWDLKIPSNGDTDMLVKGGVVVGNQGFMELDGKAGNGRVVSTSSSCRLVNPKLFFNRAGIASSSVGDYDTWDSSLIDLKLGRFSDYRDTKSGNSTKEVRVSSSIVSQVPPVKRLRSMNSNGQAPFCQVHGCNMDLSSSKDYHKRHKVCEIHSKTARVIVNGVEQRFCQQCSRFHLLAEFDDGKRSCRKRLAGHNRRRRKPQLDNHCGRIGKLLPSCHGSRFTGTSSPAGTSFICSDIFPSGIVREVRHEKSYWCQLVKVEDEANTQPLMPVMNGHLFQKPFHSTYGMEKQFPSLRCIDTSSSSVCYENGNRYVQDFAGSHSVFQKASSGTEEFASFNTSSTVEGLPGFLDSDRALSLLSTQSQNSLTHLSAISMAQPLTIQGRHIHYNVGQFPDKLLPVSSLPSASMESNQFSSIGMEDDHMGAVLISDASNVVAFEAQAENDFLASGFVNSNDTILSPEHGHTIDLLQLSSQLRSAELKRHSIQVKQEGGTFFYHPIP